MTSTRIGEAQGVAERVWINGIIYTVDRTFSKADALAVGGGKILAVGTRAEVRKWIGPETILHDVGGRCITPGLQDSHGHMTSLGSLALGRIDLRNTRSYDELLRSVEDRIAEATPGEWILGGRWDQSLWGQDEFPSNFALSAISPHNPVWLTRVDGHAGLANRQALVIAGITGETRNPPGGEILRDGDGNATGLLVDNAMGLVTRHIPGGSSTPTELILAAEERCLAVGLTGVHDAGIGEREIEAYRKLAREGRLKIRIYAMIAGHVGPDYFNSHGPEIGEHFTLRATKLVADGAMGSRGAWLLAPYADRPEDADGKPYTGFPIQSPGFIAGVSLAALQNGWQVATHAIGGRAIRETLNAYQGALERAPRKDHRFRIEHAQLPAPEDIPRFVRLGVIPSMQPTHATSDMRWAEARVGRERLKTAYAWRKFLAAGSQIAGGSDFPVESENPLLGIYAAVTRTDSRGLPEGGWYPGERMTREEALRAFTTGPAHAAFEEDIKGSLVPGKLADFVVWTSDIVTCPPGELLEAGPVMVIVGGEIVMKRNRQQQRQETLKEKNGQ